MSRQVAHGGRHVYDSVTDSWLGPFDTEEEAYAYASMESDPQKTEEFYDRGVPTISAYSYSMVGTASNAWTEVAAFNPGRLAVVFKYVGSGTLLIGTKEGVAAGQGYALTSGAAERFTVAASVFATLNATFSGVLYVFCEEITAGS